MIEIGGFQGEVPRVNPRLLPNTHAQIAENCRLLDGSLSPFRIPELAHTLGATALSIYKHGSEWLGWNSATIKAVPGPVAQDRLYITGDGVPKLRVGSTTYPLAVPSPTAAPTRTLRNIAEYLQIDGKTVRLSQGFTTTSSVNGLQISVSISANKATVTISKSGGISAAAMQAVIAGIQYQATTSLPFACFKIVKITQIRDTGGQQVDAYRNPIGSDTRVMDDIGTTIRVGGTTRSYTFPPQEPHDGTDIGGQNDPPTLVYSAFNPTYTIGVDVWKPLFSGATISTVEAGQNINLLRLTVEGLNNGIVDRKNMEELLYCYTFVTDLGEESLPSPLTSRIEWSSGHVVVLQGIQAPPGGTRITKQRFYRSVTTVTGQTQLFFIAERTASTDVFHDDPEEGVVGEPCAALDYDQPPSTLQGLVAMPNGMMAGYVGREIFFCEPYVPHAWPQKYSVVVDNNILGLIPFGSSLAIVTTGHPYIAQGTHPSNMVFEKAEVNLPCVAIRSVVDLGYAGAYASNDGLVLVDQGGARIITRSLITQEQWLGYNPSTFIASQYEGRYVVSYQPPAGGARRTMILDVSGEYGQPFIMRHTAVAQAWHYDLNGSLYFLEGGTAIKLFDPALTGTPMTMRWRSKRFVMPRPVSYGAIIVEGEGPGDVGTLSVKVYADGFLIADIIGQVNVPVRLPSERLATFWEIEVGGAYPITGVAMAKTVRELLDARGGA